ncbi:hypothetical protein G6F50_017767 [Rhizopus delemar]|uniref:Uncharacterized protein n=1 Tax=Rhizopus delemar TaxID=936053 RepID=A0A9P6XPI5_9FUNG|nr:hypothetical protein G6F50_017767 [Rhizopus delemar]
MMSLARSCSVLDLATLRFSTIWSSRPASSVSTAWAANWLASADMGQSSLVTPSFFSCSVLLSTSPAWYGTRATGATARSAPPPIRGGNPRSN